MNLHERSQDKSIGQSVFKITAPLLSSSKCSEGPERFMNAIK